MRIFFRNKQALTTYFINGIISVIRNKKPFGRIYADGRKERIIMAKKVLIGMSGGVDSSVAAYLLKEQGYEVVGVTMRMWTPDTGEAYGPAEDAKKVCEKLGIAFYVMDMQDTFRQAVVQNFIEEYKRGRTPNPCVVCNKYIKFGLFYQRAMEMGADYIATGHYAVVSYNEVLGEHELRMSKTIKKDQTYMLYNLNQEILSHTLMPLGDYTKDSVREIAAGIDLPVAGKPDSQEICFVPNDDYGRFIEAYGNYSPEPGSILDTDGNVIGTHRGLIYYTIGQRKGIGAYGRPMFVMKINPKENTIILGEKGMEFSDTFFASDVNMISGKPLTEARSAQIKTRYHARPAPGMLIPEKDGVRVIFSEAQRAVTPGQAAVFYDGEKVLGGGTIEI